MTGEELRNGLFINRVSPAIFAKKLGVSRQTVYNWTKLKKVGVMTETAYKEFVINESDKKIGSGL